MSYQEESLLATLEAAKRWRGSETKEGHRAERGCSYRRRRFASAWRWKSSRDKAQDNTSNTWCSFWPDVRPTPTRYCRCSRSYPPEMSHKINYREFIVLIEFGAFQHKRRITWHLWTQFNKQKPEITLNYRKLSNEASFTIRWSPDTVLLWLC